MIKMCIAYTYADRSRLIGYEKDTGFLNTINKLKEINFGLENSGILTTGLDGIIWLFEQFFVDKERFPDWGNAICIYNKEEFISKIPPNLLSFKSKSIYESWLLMLRNLNTDIDELFRYGATDMDEYVVFLKDILIFLSYTIILDNEKDYIKHTNS